MSEFTANATEPTTDPSDGTTPPKLPRAVLSTSREEFYGQDAEHQPLELIVKEGMTENTCLLPEDLQGHVFIVGAVGYVNSTKPDPDKYPFVVEPATDKSQEGYTSLINGEGMIYRLDFHQTTQNKSCEPKEELGKAWMATRIVKTPDHYADNAFETQLKKYKNIFSSLEDWFLKFSNFGVTRVSLLLGARNYLNTAFLPMKFSSGKERLLVTWDAGSPYEIDPCSLGLVAPVGWHDQWKPMIEQDVLKWVFPPLLSTAHPVFDTHAKKKPADEKPDDEKPTHENEMFTVNGSKSLRTVLGVFRSAKFNAKEWAERHIKIPILKQIVAFILGLFITIFFDIILWFLRVFVHIEGEDFIGLNRWTGSGTAIEQWQVVDEEGEPIKVLQSLHQMAVTKDYIILSDSAFKIVLEDILPLITSQNRILQKLNQIVHRLRPYLSYPQLPHTDLSIISRKDLISGAKTVSAKRVRIYPETAHFLADYQNPNGKITLFVAHTAASDPAEFLHGDDRSVYGDSETVELKECAGMFVSPMDANRLGGWTIDVNKLGDFNADPKQTQACEHFIIDSFDSEEFGKEYLYSLSLYAWSGFQPDRFTEIYWNCWGAWSELLSEFIREMYEDYKYRDLPVKELCKSIQEGKPANLLRMHADRSSVPPKLTIEDVYCFPPGYFGNSPQFISRPDPKDPTDGYITCVVLYDIEPSSDKNTPNNPLSAQRCELWIFDGKNVSDGPRYRLSHPRLNMGVTIHSTWLSKLETPPVRTDYSVRKDYEAAVAATGSKAIEDLFEDEIYPHFES